MHERQFYINYGGPGESWLAEDQIAIDALQRACLKYYTRPHRQTTLIIDDIQVTIRTDGIHRSLHLKIMQKEGETDKEYGVRDTHFKSICGPATELASQPYVPTQSNCVTITAYILAQLDPNITPPNEWLPWRLDNHIKKYCGKYCAKSTEGIFIKHYQEKIHRAVFVGSQRWTAHHKIESLNDIILHAHGKSGGSGERTKSSLIELGWVKEGKNGLLEPLEAAPPDFKNGLVKYNKDVQEIQALKQLNKEAGGFRLSAYLIFKGDPDKDTVIERMRARRLKEKNGASAKVLEDLQTEEKEEAASHKPEDNFFGHS